MYWTEKNGKYIICKDGVYFALDGDQLIDLLVVLTDIISGDDQFYKKDSRR